MACWVLTSVSTPPLGLSARSTRCIHIPGWRICACCWDGSPGCSRRRFSCVLMNCWSLGFFCHNPSTFQCTMRNVWWPIALSCNPSPPSLPFPPTIRRGPEPQSVALDGPFWGWGPGAVPPWLRPTRLIPQRPKDNSTAILSLLRRQPISYPRQVGCVILLRRLKLLLRVASSPRIAVLPSWRVHPTGVCDLRFHRIDGLSFRTCERHLPDCYDLQQDVALFRLHNCWESQVLALLICRWGWTIWPVARYDFIRFHSRWNFSSSSACLNFSSSSTCLPLGHIHFVLAVRYWGLAAPVNTYRHEKALHRTCSG